MRDMMTIIRDPYARPIGIRIEVALDGALEALLWDDEFAWDLSRLVGEAEDRIVELDREDR